MSDEKSVGEVDKKVDAGSKVTEQGVSHKSNGNKSESVQVEEKKVDTTGQPEQPEQPESPKEEKQSETSQEGKAVAIGEYKDEELVEELISRFECYQGSEMKCEDTRKAKIAALQVRNRLADRTRKRKEQGVQGTAKPHRG